MATTIDYASDYGGGGSDYQTTMKRLCPLMDLARVVAMGASCGRAAVELEAIQCKGGSCAWYDQTAERCAVLSLARNK